MDEITPSFIYVGAPKAGSTWLFEALREHPQVFVTPEKSTTYFEVANQGSIKDYLHRFASAENARAIGEISHDIFLVPGAAERIAAVFPEMKIIICLREPGDFARSATQWWSAHTTRYGETPAEMFAHERLENLLDYTARLSPFFQAFPRNQIKVLFFDNLKADPLAYLSEIFTFIDVDPDIRVSVVEQVVNAAGRARLRPLTHLAYKTGGMFRRLGFGAIVEAIKHKALVERMLYAPLKPDPSPEIETHLKSIRERAQPGLQQLEELIQMPLPAGWKIH